jgi:peptidoglycan/xylan/chitin deacetylase (PgdA/CDA1 family)
MRGTRRVTRNFRAAVACAGFGALLAAAPAQAQTVVTLGFDDGPLTQYSARQTLLNHGMRATFFVNSGLTSDEPTWRMSWSQLHQLAADGHEITGHTLTHADLTQVTAAQRQREICDDRTSLLNRGFSPVSSLAYPYGAYNDDVEATARQCGYSSARTVGQIRSFLCGVCPFAETIPPSDPFATRTPPDIRDTTTLDTMKRYVTQAEENGGGWVQLVFHHVCDSGCGEYSIPLARLTAFLDWLQPRAANGTVVKTTAAGMGDAPPPPPPGGDLTAPTTTIACDGTACGSAWYPAAVSVTLTATDTGGSGLAETRFTIDGSDPTQGSLLYTGPFSVAADTTVRFRSWDNAGNLEATRSQVVRVDTTAPTVSVISPADGATLKKGPPSTIEVAASDVVSNVAKVDVRVDGSTVGTDTSPPYAIAWRTKGWAQGPHQLTATATDAAGNVATSGAVRVTLR